MDGGGFLFAPRSDRQQEYVRARIQQRFDDGRFIDGLDLPSKRLAQQAADSNVGGLLVQHIERYDLSSIKSPASTHKYAEPDIISASRKQQQQHEAAGHARSVPMDPADAIAAAGNFDTAVHEEHNLRQRPFQLRHGRRYIRNESYPLPCDLQELHRQSLETLLGCTVFGQAVCAPLSSPPARVLEVGCGAAYWTSKCHQMFSSLGHDDIMYTGLDVAPLAPDLRKQGLNWNFVQHDMRRMPWPFDDETFDFIMCKDLSLAVPLGAPSRRMIDECIRLLRIGGTLEIWETDHTIRSILPHQLTRREDEWEQRLAESTATFSMSPTTPFGPTQNRYLKSANAWIDKALGNRQLPSTPCARVAGMLLQESSLGDVGIRRIAIPLSALGWEHEERSKQQPDRKARSRTRSKSHKLNHEQLGVREAALLAVVQMIESLEPILKDASGKTAEEWSYWWASMMQNLSTPGKQPLSGECLEIGAWWATKLGDSDDDDDDNDDDEYM